METSIEFGSLLAKQDNLVIIMVIMVIVYYYGNSYYGSIFIYMLVFK